MTLNKVREDLTEIRYYYSRIKVFESSYSLLGKSAVQELAERYAKIIKFAPAQLYDLYVGLYIKGKTQEVMAMEIGYSIEHIRRLNKNLLLFLQSKLSK